MSVTTVGTTTTIDSTLTAAEGAALTFPANTNLVITVDSGTPANDAVSVDLHTRTDFTNVASLTVSNNATVVLGDILTAAASPALNLDGGTLTVEATTAGTYDVVNVGSAGGILSVDLTGLNVGALNVPVSFTGGVIPTGFEVDFPGIASVTADYNGTDTVLHGTLAGLIGRFVTLPGNPYGLTSGGSEVFTTSDGNGGTIVCFLPGTLIATPAGEVAVETLRIGDEVICLVDGERVARRLVWTGSQRVDPLSGGDSIDLQPVRILEGALAEGVPHCDLLVTPEHCLLFDGRLVPARMLVNGRSILSEPRHASFVVHHVETEEHAVIIANGVLSESYLDTGNRWRFTQRGGVVRLPSAWRDQPQKEAVAPVCVERAIVEPLWLSIMNRADALGFDDAPAAPALTDDPKLHLVLASGRKIDPLYSHGGVAVFSVPAGHEQVWIASNASRPSDVTGPFLDDRRRLGVLVGDIVIWSLGTRRPVATHFAGGLPGWHDVENGRRWSDGYATLPLPDVGAAAGTMLIEMQILAAGPYLSGFCGSREGKANPLAEVA